MLNGCQESRVVKKALIIYGFAVMAVAAGENTISRSGSEGSSTYSARDVKVLGDLEFGKRSEAVDYSDRPPYRAFVFSAFGGETVEIKVDGGERTAFVALADSTLTRLVSGKTNVSLSLPKHGPYIECWYIVF